MASFFNMNQIGGGFMPMEQQPQSWMQRGLLNPLTHMGLGLLAESAPKASYDPGGAMPNYGRGLLAGAQSYQMAQQGQAQQQYRDEILRQRQQEALAKQQEADRALQQEQARAQAQQAYLLTLPPEQRQQAGALLGMGVSGDKVMGLLNPKQDLPPEAKLGEWLAPGGSREEQQAAVQQWKLDQARAGASNVSTTVRLPDTQQPIGKDAREYAMPDGSTPSPMMSVEQIVKAGGRVLSDTEKADRKIAADVAAKEREFTRRVAESQKSYDAARKAFETTPNAETKRNLDRAAHALRVALGQQANIMGEPSDFVSRGMEIPGAGGVLSDQLLIDPLMGIFSPSAAKTFGVDPQDPTQPPPGYR